MNTDDLRLSSFATCSRQSPTSFINRWCSSFVSREESIPRVADLALVHKRLKTLPDHGTLGAHKTPPPHFLGGVHNVTRIILHVVNLIILRVMDLHASRGTLQGKQARAPLASPENGAPAG